MHQRGPRIGFVLLMAITAIAPLHAAAAELPGAPYGPARLPNLAPIDSVRSGNPLWGVPFANLAMTRERPLFSASRRPPAQLALATASAAPPLPVAAALPPERPTLVLIGTIIGPSLQTGVFRDESSDKIVQLSTGGHREGWTLRSVSRNEARFEMAERTAVLPLRPPVHAMPQDRFTPRTTGPSRRREWFDN